MKILLKLIVSLMATLLGLVVFYGVVAVVLSGISVNEEAPVATEGTAVYITTNGVHADFVLPVNSPALDWRDMLSLQDYAGANADFAYVAFGWGDKGFYLHTPTWADLTLTTAVNALFLPSPTAMHVTFYRSAPAPGEDSRRLILSPEQYKQLIHYIQESFERDEQGNIQLIRNAGYGPYDNFYEARGSYSLLYTCNNWVNEGLKEIEVHTALWSPFDWGILQNLE